MKIGVAMGWEQGANRKGFLNGYKLFFWCDENILNLDIGVGCTTLRMH